MPTYEYECKGCRHQFEVFQTITAQPLKQCPKCKKRTLRRLIGTGAGIIFKGSGFYQTDYRSDHYKKRAKEEKSSVESAGVKKDGAKSAGSGSKDKSSSPGKTP